MTHPYAVLTNSEIDLIHRSALRILSEMGMEIQNRELLADLTAIGAVVNLENLRVRFPKKIVDGFIAEVPRYNWDEHVPHVNAFAGVYHGMFHDPVSTELVPWTEDRLAMYFAVAAWLEHVDGAGMLGCRLPVPPPLIPLYERSYCWKYGGSESGSIHLDELCPYLHELYQVRADYENLPMDGVFRGTVYLVPPLTLGYHEAYQLQYFRERGLRVGIGNMLVMGGSAPVTFAGAAALNWAVQLAKAIVNWAWFGTKRLHFDASVSALDMRTMIYPYGRPEMAAINMMSAQMARRFGVPFSGHAGLSDAKLPSAESGAQKALTAIPTLMAGGSASIAAGLLSIDEVCSPIQMVLDNELVGALKHLLKPFVITDEKIGLETILEAGPGGHYFDTLHTARHFREEVWEPTIWSRHMLSSWLSGDRKIDADRAREMVLDMGLSDSLNANIDDSFEREVQKVITEAASQLLRR